MRPQGRRYETRSYQAKQELTEPGEDHLDPYVATRAVGEEPSIHLVNNPDSEAGSGRVGGYPGPGRPPSRSPYQSRIRRRRGNRRLRRIGPLALFVALLAASLGWCTHTPCLSIHTILVQGNQLIPTERIEQEAGIVLGSNLLAASTRKVRERFSRDPAIEDVRLIRRFPHTLVIKVQEYHPWAAVRAGGQTYLLSMELKVIATCKCAPPGIPLVLIEKGNPSTVAPLGGTEQAEDLVAALACLRKSQDPDYRISISRVFIDAKRNIWLNVSGLGKVTIGQPENLGPKLVMLQTLVRTAPAFLHHVQYIDLQNPDAPAYVPRAGETGPGDEANTPLRRGLK